MKYFHASAITKRRRRNIICLKNDKGGWIDEASNLRSMATRFFK